MFCDKRVRSSMSRTAVTLKFKMSLSFEKWKKKKILQTNSNHEKGYGRETETFIGCYNDLASFYVLKGL